MTTDASPRSTLPVILPSKITFSDTLDAIRSRTSNSFRMKFITKSGLYALGSPTKDSPVLVTANYTLSVNALRAALAGRDAWILVIDTKGINVWCAAGKGTFCTKAIVQEISASALSEAVSHRNIILPQLGASGVNATKLQRESGFKVKYGPVRASDIPAYIDNNFTATTAMRRVEFTLADRAKLVPMEVLPAAKPVVKFLVAAALLFGISRTGILFKPALSGVFPLALAGGTALLAGSVLTQLLLPIIPFRAFTLKGFLLGSIGTAVLIATVPSIRSNLFLTLLCSVAVPAYSSYCAFLFTGSTTYTSPTGVKAELKKAWPLYIATASISLILFGGVLLRFWGITFS